MAKKGAKVMVVDDDKVFLNELKEMLSMNGYEVIAVADPMAALAVVAQKEPDCILMDLKMPGMSGIHLAYEVEKFLGSTETPIIAMSAYFDEGYDYLINFCRIKGCLKKPFNSSEAIAQIESALKEKKDRKSAPTNSTYPGL